MNILHICTSVNGGAGKATLRLHTALLGQGIDSKILLMSGCENHKKFIYVAKPEKRTLSKKILSRFGFFRNAYQKTKYIKKQLLHNWDKFNSFTFPISDYRLHKNNLLEEADIVNLHWIGNYVDFRSFFKNIKIPIVWTLHDKNPILGGLHYENDLFANFLLWNNVEKKLKKIKSNSIKKCKNVIIVSPSEALKIHSMKSEIFRSYRHVIIPNGLNTKIFKPIKNKNNERKTILFSSGSIGNIWKGFDILIKALKILGNNYYCLALGENKSTEIKNNLNINYLGYITNEKSLAEIYSKADVFVIPTLEDNLPNTVIEAMACGTPIIGANVGGVPEMVRENITGLLFEAGNSEDLACRIAEYFDLPEVVKKEMSENCRKIVMEEYNQNIQANRYIKLYKEVLNIK